MTDILVETYKYLLTEIEKEESDSFLFRCNTIITIFWMVGILFSSMIEGLGLNGIWKSEYWLEIGKTIERNYGHLNETAGHSESWLWQRENLICIFLSIVLVDLLIRIGFLLCEKKGYDKKYYIQKIMFIVDIFFSVFRDLLLLYVGGKILIDSFGVNICILTSTEYSLPYIYPMLAKLILLLLMARLFLNYVHTTKKIYNNANRDYQWTGFFDADDKIICYYDLLICNNILYRVEKECHAASKAEEWVLKPKPQEDDSYSYPVFLLRDKANEVKIYKKYYKRARYESVKEYHSSQRKKRVRMKKAKTIFTKKYVLGKGKSFQKCGRKTKNQK